MTAAVEPSVLYGPEVLATAQRFVSALDQQARDPKLEQVQHLFNLTCQLREGGVPFQVVSRIITSRLGAPEERFSFVEARTLEDYFEGTPPVAPAPEYCRCGHLRSEHSPRGSCWVLMYRTADGGERTCPCEDFGLNEWDVIE